MLEHFYCRRMNKVRGGSQPLSASRRYSEAIVGPRAFGETVRHGTQTSRARRTRMKRVLIPGAGGGIGRSLRDTLRGVYPVLRLSDRITLPPAREGEEVDRSELSDMAAVEGMVADVDGIIHLGGISGETEWPVILEGNII